MKQGSRFFIEYSENDEGGKKLAQKGRSSLMIENRDEKLLHRYYYHARILQIRYDNVLEALEIEFDLSRVTIVKIIAKNTARLKQIADSALTREQLKSKYPFLNWSDKVAAPQYVKKEVYNRY